MHSELFTGLADSFNPSAESVVSKRYQFNQQVITVNEELSELNFSAQELLKINKVR
jgi:uncharacterized coiled-coil DUF342 family protein